MTSDDQAQSYAHMHRGQGNFLMGVVDSQIDPEIVFPATQLQHQAGHVALEFQRSLQPSEQQQPLQRYMNESTQMGPLRTSGFYPHSHAMAGPVSTFPRRVSRMPSPTPSLHSYGPTNPSSADSPAAESDLLFESSPASGPYTPDLGTMTFAPWPIDSIQFLPDMSIGAGYSSNQHYSLPSTQNSLNCVNMSQVQSFADPPQEFGYDDEGYGAAVYGHSNGDSITVDHHHLKSDEGVATYHFSEEDNFGDSAIDATSVHNTVASPATQYEGIEDEEPEIAPSPASDTSYSPKTTRTRKRSAPSSREAEAPSKRTRTSRAKFTKPSITLTTNGGAHRCSFCEETFKDPNLLSRHVLKAHTKAFQCVFAFAGCTSVFGTKNEWKRHVSSQHMNLLTWICTQGTCGQPHPAPRSSASARNNRVVVNTNTIGGEFNRKDLFTQHLKRMHVPDEVKSKSGRQRAAFDAWEAQIKHLQTSCLHQNRAPPSQLGCPLQGCSVIFSGNNCWDDRMEHVGKHLEKMATEAAKTSVISTLNQGADPLLVNWALSNAVVVADGHGGYKFPGAAAATTSPAAGEEDADGEEEE